MTLPPVRVSNHHEVPTHLNVEDKVVLGLSVRQFLYMLVGSSASYTLWEQSATLGAEQGEMTTRLVVEPVLGQPTHLDVHLTAPLSHVP